ncbi:hypothetical protein LFZ30_10435 [Salmonella enterica subsp. enterica serovar Moscow str. SA20061414]|nr:hypothetical protein LFZ30_10435 [Salmonella enterica subsp. enterica serovar Moscow str. SA20061414]
MNRACSGPERGDGPGDGLSSGAASWTDDEPARRLARRGEQSEVNPPLTAIFKKELVRKYGLLYLNFLFLL